MPSRRDPLLRTLGERVRQAREARGLSQEALGAAAGLDRTYVSGIERGIRNVSVLRLADIATALGTKLSSLIPDS